MLGVSQMKLPLIEVKLLSLGILIKLILIAICGSLMLENYFGPVIEHYLSTFPSNPYNYFSNTAQPEKFPYPALMLYILSLFQYLFGWAENLFI